MNEGEAFKALVAREDAEGRFELRLEERHPAELPPGELLIRVDFSSLNFKDALSAGGNRGVTKRYPHTPGIDAAGLVVESAAPAFSPGDEVVVTGFDLGMNTPGGWGRYIRIPAGWALPLPRGLSARESMAIGTAGLTAALAVTRLLAVSGTEGSELPYLVSGASGGVGSFAVALLASVGRRVVAVSGKPEAAAYLQALGASQVIGREEATDQSGRALLAARWAGGVDAVGGALLSSLVRSTAPFGAVAACGNAQEARFEANVYPFILRGVSLLGIESAQYPLALRSGLWERLAGDWRSAWERVRVVESALAELPDQVALMREGRVAGRVVVNLSS